VRFRALLDRVGAITEAVGPLAVENKILGALP